MQQPLVSGDLDDAAVGREVAAQDHESAGFLERVLGGCDDFLPGRFFRARRFLRASVRPVGVSVVAADQTAVDHPLRDQADAAGRVDVERDVRAAGSQIGDDRRPFADAVEIVDRQRHAGLARHREQVQHALVEPPVAAAAAIAFSNASRVQMSRGRRLRRSSSITIAAGAIAFFLLARIGRAGTRRCRPARGR